MGSHPDSASLNLATTKLARVTREGMFEHRSDDSLRQRRLFVGALTAVKTLIRAA
jgi:hypothetical protein